MNEPAICYDERMDLIILVLLLCLVGFVIYLATTHIPMPPYWASAIQIGALILLILYLVSRFTGGVPNLLP